MKNITQILAFTVIFLSAKPAIDAVSLWPDAPKSCFSSTKCDPHAESQEKEHESEQETNEMCNPFQSCVSCALFFVSTPHFIISKTQIALRKFSEYQSLIASQFIADFWQPPKFV